MEGVTILQTIPQMESTWGWNWIFLLYLIPLALGIMLIVMAYKFQIGGLIVFGILIIYFSIGGALVCASEEGEVRSHDHYQVLIDDSVSMVEFMDKYNIIEQQGITYIIEEKAE